MNQRKFFIAVSLLLLGGSALAQNGYIKFKNNQIATGFIKVHYAATAHEHQVELSLSSNDPNPKRYHKKDILEYAIHKDTFRILKEFYPYEVEQIYYEVIDAKVIHSGKISLLEIHNSFTTLDKGLFEALHDQNPSQVPYFYVLQDIESGYVRGVPSKKGKFREVLKEFYSDEILAAYEKEHGAIHFKDLEKFVVFGNQRVN